MVSTEMTEDDMVFGGTEKLLDTVLKIKNRRPRPKAVIVVSSCPAGIIGDDIEKAKALSEPGFSCHHPQGGRKPYGRLSARNAYDIHPAGKADNRAGGRCM